MKVHNFLLQFLKYFFRIKFTTKEMVNLLLTTSVINLSTLSVSQSIVCMKLLGGFYLSTKILYVGLKFSCVDSFLPAGNNSHIR